MLDVQEFYEYKMSIELLLLICDTNLESAKSHPKIIEKR